MYTQPTNREGIIRSIYRALYKDRRWSCTLWGLALVSLDILLLFTLQKYRPYREFLRRINPANGDVSDCQLNAGRGGSNWPRLKIYLNVFRFTRNLVWLFLIAICTNMQKIRPISQKFTEILRFKNFEITRFCCTLTYENCCNSLNF